jgi:heme oxygenase (biliverdin-IX-beta and delta-forming)
VSARFALKAATAAEHERIDRLFGAACFSTSNGYRAFLRAQAAAFLPIEAALDQAGVERLIEDWPARRRGDLLRADFAEFGDALPPPLPGPRFNGPAGAAGCIYVLEGSRLGGAVLKRALPADAPRRFLAAPQTPGSWRKLLERLDTLLYRPDLVDAAIQAARHVFQRFEAGGLIYLQTERACEKAIRKSI